MSKAYELLTIPADTPGSMNHQFSVMLALLEERKMGALKKWLVHKDDLNTTPLQRMRTALTKLGAELRKLKLAFPEGPVNGAAVELKPEEEAREERIGIKVHSAGIPEEEAKRQTDEEARAVEFDKQLRKLGYLRAEGVLAFARQEGEIARDGASTDGCWLFTFVSKSGGEEPWVLFAKHEEHAGYWRIRDASWMGEEDEGPMDVSELEGMKRVELGEENEGASGGNGRPNQGSESCPLKESTTLPVSPTSQERPFHWGPAGKDGASLRAWLGELGEEIEGLSHRELQARVRHHKKELKAIDKTGKTSREVLDEYCHAIFGAGLDPDPGEEGGILETCPLTDQSTENDW